MKAYFNIEKVISVEVAGYTADEIEELPVKELDLLIEDCKQRAMEDFSLEDLYEENILFDCFDD